MTRKTTEQFIEEAQQVWGDKFDYSKVEYKTRLEKVCIICPEHGEFWQTPAQHLSGALGCKACWSEKYSKSTEDFIKEAIKIHGDKYNYSKTIYKTARQKVTIICPKHGEFEQLANAHLQGEGCFQCERERRAKSTENFIKEAKKVHGDTYDYCKVNYINRNTPVIIICPKHGEFEQLPSNHLQGKGCSHCKSKEQAALFNRLVEDFPNEEILYEVGNRIVPWLEGQRFDIYFPKYNIAIEYNGPQHYMPIQKLGGELAYLKTIERDREKRKKCKENGCVLFELKYKYSEQDYINLKNNILCILIP